MADDSSKPDQGQESQESDSGNAQPPKPDPRLVEWVTRDTHGDQKSPKSRDAET